MPIPLPLLDDRRFSDLVPLLRDLIPGETTLWDDFNPSDPGITLVELWSALAEQVLYRIDLVSNASETNFLKLLLDPALPVTADVRLRLAPQFGIVEIPPGIQFHAHVLSPSQTLVFETYQTTLSTDPLSPPGEIEMVVSVRSRVVVQNELLGTSSGEPDQVFQLADGPVLVDDRNIGTLPGDYNPNARISVDGVPWEFVPDFLEAATGPLSPHYMVEKRTGCVRFGNHLKGRVPVAGAHIVADQYQVIRGPEVRVGADSLTLVDSLPGVLPADVLSVRNRPAEGGEFIYSFKDQARSTGLELFAGQSRVVTRNDLTLALVEQFNRQQISFVSPGPPELVERAFAVPNRDLRGAPPYAPLPGALSVVILPKPDPLGATPFTPSPTLIQQFRHFLDRRRLITTRVHVVGPRPVVVTLAVQVAPESAVDVPLVRAAVAARLRAFFHPFTGGDDGAGWPVGRDVYRSEIFQQAESVEGVDFVLSVAINGSTAVSRLRLEEIDLPDLAVTVTV